MLIRALNDPASVAGLPPAGWNVLLRQSRRHALNARLGHTLRHAGLWEAVPGKARSHLIASMIAAESTHTAVRFEVDRVLRALSGLDVPVVLMKGCAYVHAGLPPARGRFIGDVDLMVPRARIEAVEQRLLERGWAASDLDAYDQRYYREWTHEIPPMQHPERETPVDIHHTILPLTARARPDAAALLADALPLADARLSVLAPADMVLHSCVHLFNDEVGMPLRDLFDLHDLLRHFGERPGFWPELLARAERHGLQRPLHYMLRHCAAILGTPVPAEVQSAAARLGPSWPLRPLMDALFAQRFRVRDRDTAPGPVPATAEFLLYLRTHWLRMPAPMLTRHLAVKGWRRLRAQDAG